MSKNSPADTLLYGISQLSEKQKPLAAAQQAVEE